MFTIEEVRPGFARGAFRSAIFDFDGTISLIREGWQQVMVPYFIEVLRDTPGGRDEAGVESVVRDFVDFLTGKQTIYQCIRLAEEVEQRGGKPLDPLEYKKEYSRRLLVRIDDRLAGLRGGKLDPATLRVPGSMRFLTKLRERGVKLYLASGTDIEYVRDEVRLLKLESLFEGGIYGALDSFKDFSKAMIISQMIRENDLHGSELVGFGDGYVEIENTCEVGGFAVGMATDEVRREGIDEWKRGRLIAAGAHIICPDFSDPDALVGYLFPG